MDLSIAALLAQDGITNGAIYALLALALVLVFTVTRVIFIPAGEFVAYGTLTLAALQLGKPPGTVGLLIGAGADRGRDGGRRTRRDAAPGARCRAGSRSVPGVPLAIAGARAWRRAAAARRCRLQIAARRWRSSPRWGRCCIASPTSRSPRPRCWCCSSSRSPCISCMLGLGLWFFGAEGSRTPAFTDASLRIGEVNVSGQSLLVLLFSLLLIVALVPLLRAHALRQGAARDGAEPRRRAAGGHPPDLAGSADLPRWRRCSARSRAC